MVYANSRSPGHAQRTGSNQGLDFHQHGSRTFQAGDYHRPWYVLGPFFKKDAGGVVHLAQPAVLHLKDPDFIGGAVAVLDRPEYPKCMPPVSFKVENCIHQMFQYLWPGNGTFLGHMADQKYGHS